MTSQKSVKPLSASACGLLSAKESPDPSSQRHACTASSRKLPRRWALLVPIKYPAGIGEHMVKLVLVAPTEYANRDQTAWPGARTLADDVSGLHRRDVTNALEVLEKLNGLIARDGKRGRAIVWRFVITDVDVSASVRHIACG